MMSSTNVTNDCAKNRLLNYRCTNGKCTLISSFCPTSSECPQSYRGYFCPATGWCERRDASCLRPCGFINDLNRKYDYWCSAYPGFCGQTSYDCPPVCSSQRPHKCLGERKCAEGPNWCSYCSGFRCESDGKCIGSYRKCDSFRDCSDGSDEISCYMKPVDTDDGNELGMESWQIMAICGVVMLVLLLCTYWCCKKSSNSSGEQSRAATNQEGQTTTSSGPRLTGTRVTSARTSIPPHQSGYHPMTTVPTNNTPNSYTPRARSYPVDQPIDSVPSSRQPAASNYPLSPPSPSVTPRPNENPTAAPPPSYSDVIENEDRYQQKDPALPTYQEYTESPSAKETFM